MHPLKLSTAIIFFACLLFFCACNNSSGKTNTDAKTSSSDTKTGSAYTLKALGQTTNMQNDEWYSSDVPGSQYLSPVIFENHSAN